MDSSVKSAPDRGFTRTNFQQNLRGFTLIELLVSIGIIMILLAFSSLSLLRVQYQASANTTLSTLINDLRSQQTKAMTGDTEGRGTSANYGVYFEADRYTLYHGDTFIPGDAGNFVIMLSPQVRFSNITLPGSLISFTKASGEVVDYVSGSDNVSLDNLLDNSSKTLHFNWLGVVETVQ